MRVAIDRAGADVLAGKDRVHIVLGADVEAGIVHAMREAIHRVSWTHGHGAYFYFFGSGAIVAAGGVASVSRWSTTSGPRPPGEVPLGTTGFGAGSPFPPISPTAV